MFYKIKKFYNPIFYHGENKNNYFEGWYYKISYENRNIAFIPGISKNNKEHFSFIQIIDSEKENAIFKKYDINKFIFDKNRFIIKIEQNYFSKDRLKINIDNYVIDLKIDDLVPPLKNIIYPGVMGPYSYFPKMECNHGIITMKSNIEGKINNNNINGNIYIEKDWGTSFPKAWIWAQGYFKNSSLSMSIAKIPFLNFVFNGFLIFFYHNNKIYKFTTYNGSKIDYIQNDENLKIKITKRDYSLKIKLYMKKGSILKAPELGKMVNHIKESMDSEIEIELKSKGKIIFSERLFNVAAEKENIELLIH
ncbi:MAG: tocopherol cyclase family protein [Thermotogota bacterium]